MWTDNIVIGELEMACDRVSCYVARKPCIHQPSLHHSSLFPPALLAKTACHCTTGIVSIYYNQLPQSSAHHRKLLLPLMGTDIPDFGAYRAYYATQSTDFIFDDHRQIIIFNLYSLICGVFHSEGSINTSSCKANGNITRSCLSLSVWRFADSAPTNSAK